MTLAGDRMIDFDGPFAYLLCITRKTLVPSEEANDDGEAARVLLRR